MCCYHKEVIIQSPSKILEEMPPFPNVVYISEKCKSGNVNYIPWICKAFHLAREVRAFWTWLILHHPSEETLGIHHNFGTS